MGIWDRITGWWGQDSVEREESAVAADSQSARDAADEDFEGLKDDQSIGGSYVGGADYERDSERPPSY